MSSTDPAAPRTTGTRASRYGAAHRRARLSRAGPRAPHRHGLLPDLRERAAAGTRRAAGPDGAARPVPHRGHRRHRRAAQHAVRRVLRAAAGAPLVPRQGLPQHADRRAVRGLADRGRAGAGARLRAHRLVRRLAHGQRHPGDLRLAVHGAGHHLRLAALRRARGRARAAGSGRRAGPGGAHARGAPRGRRSGASRCRRSAPA